MAVADPTGKAAVPNTALFSRSANLMLPVGSTETGGPYTDAVKITPVLLGAAVRTVDVAAMVTATVTAGQRAEFQLPSPVYALDDLLCTPRWRW